MTSPLNRSTISRFKTAISLAQDEVSALAEPEKISFPLGSFQDAADLFSMRDKVGYTYGRTGTPATGVLEKLIATLEKGKAAVALASGQAANHLVFHTLMPKVGDEIISSSHIFGGTSSLLSNWLSASGKRAHFADPARPETFAPHINEKTRAILWKPFQTRMGGLRIWKGYQDLQKIITFLW